MAEITSNANPTPKRRLSEEEMAAQITMVLDMAAGLDEDMSTFKALASTWAVHATDTNSFDVPKNTAELAFLEAIGQLELRIVRIERTLTSRGIAIIGK